MDRASEADFRGLYDRTQRHVWRALGRAGVVREDERCELMQDVYVVAHQKRATRDPRAPEEAWVIAIAWNVGQRHRDLMRTRKEQPVDDPDALEERASDSASPEEIVARRRRYLRLMQGTAFDRRVVFDMHEVDGFSIKAIARALGIPVGTAKTRLRAAHADLAAAASRMDAREAREGGRAAALPLLLPFGVGAWRPTATLFDDAPAGTADQVWRNVRRGIDHAAVVRAVTGAAAGGKAVAGALIAAGFAAGGATVAAVLFALGLVGAEPSAPPPIVRAPDAIPIAVAPADAPDTTAATSTTGAAPAATVAVTSVSVPPAAVGGIDPEEERLLERAQAAYARGNREAARAALDEHARRFPPGRAKLGAESERLRAKVDGAGPAPSVSIPADAGRNPHRLMGSDE